MQKLHDRVPQVFKHHFFWLAVIMLIGTLVVCWNASLRQGWHVDDLFSIRIANDTYVQSDRLNDEFSNFRWGNMSDIQHIMTVDPNERFNLSIPWQGTTHEAQKSIYYSLLYIVMSFFPGTTNKYIGLILNLPFYWINIMAIYSLCKLMFDSKKRALLITLFYVCTQGAIGAAMYGRFYMMLTCASTLSMLAFMRILVADQKRIRDYVFLFIAVSIGIWTMPHFYLNLGVILIIFPVVSLLREKRFTWKHVSAELTAVLAFLLKQLSDINRSLQYLNQGFSLIFGKWGGALNSNASVTAVSPESVIPQSVIPQSFLTSFLESKPVQYIEVALNYFLRQITFQPSAKLSAGSCLILLGAILIILVIVFVLKKRKQNNTCDVIQCQKQRDKALMILAVAFSGIVYMIGIAPFSQWADQYDPFAVRYFFSGLPLMVVTVFSGVFYVLGDIKTGLTKNLSHLTYAVVIFSSVISISMPSIFTMRFGVERFSMLNSDSYVFLVAQPNAIGNFLNLQSPIGGYYIIPMSDPVEMASVISEQIVNVPTGANILLAADVNATGSNHRLEYNRDFKSALAENGHLLNYLTAEASMHTFNISEIISYDAPPDLDPDPPDTGVAYNYPYTVGTYFNWERSTTGILNKDGSFDVSGPSNGIGMYGPYADVKTGKYNFTINYEVLENPGNSEHIGTFDVSAMSGSKVYASVPMTAGKASATLSGVELDGSIFEGIDIVEQKDRNYSYAYENSNSPILLAMGIVLNPKRTENTVDENFDKLETRVWTANNAKIRIYSIKIEKVD